MPIPGVTGHGGRWVEWLRRDPPRASIEQDLLYELGAYSTVCLLRKHNAVARLFESAESGIDRGDVSADATSTDDAVVEDAGAGIPADLVETARDAVSAFVHQRFAGRAMVGLISEILTSEGFVCQTHDPGTDQGIDIMTGRGPLGLVSPRRLVQVKSSKEPIGSEVVQQLSGDIANHHGTDQRLLVAGGGLTKPAKDVALPQRFHIRGWTTGEVIGAPRRVYPVLPEVLREPDLVR